MPQIVSRSTLSLFLTALLVISAGCGGGQPEVPKADVAGLVTLMGKPFPEPVRLILFSKTTGQAPSSVVGQTGEFEFGEQILPGEYVVVLAPAAVEAPAGSGPPPMVSRSIPEKYRSEATSPHPVTVHAGPNKLTIDLKP